MNSTDSIPNYCSDSLDLAIQSVESLFCIGGREFVQLKPENVTVLSHLCPAIPASGPPVSLVATPIDELSFQTEIPIAVARPLNCAALRALWQRRARQAFFYVVSPLGEGNPCEDVTLTIVRETFSHFHVIEHTDRVPSYSSPIESNVEMRVNDAEGFVVERQNHVYLAALQHFPF